LEGRIVYTAADGGTTNVVVLDVASRGSRVLFPNARQPDIRSDGRVVVNGIGGGKNDVFTIGVDGANERKTGMHPEDSYPHWSPSGESITLQSTLGDGRERIYIQWDMTHAEEPRALSARGTYVFGRAPVWLSDWRIAFSGCNYWANGSNCGVWIANSNGTGEPQKITDRPGDRPTDGANGVLLYSSDATGNWEIYTIPVTGGTPRNLTNNPSQDVGATFSPDGSNIAFMSNRDGGWGIWVMNASGQNPHKLIALPNGFGSGWIEERLAWGS
jgi:TolB protein